LGADNFTTLGRGHELDKTLGEAVRFALSNQATLTEVTVFLRARGFGRGTDAVDGHGFDVFIVSVVRPQVYDTHSSWTFIEGSQYFIPTH